MGIKNLFNTRKALQGIDFDDLLFPIEDDDRRNLQVTILGVYKDILTVAGRNGLTPFLVGGSALGAIRHHGFIPWDDDLDVGFIRDEYEKFLPLFEKEYGHTYVVNAPNRSPNPKARFTKIMIKGTIYREIIAPESDELNGIFVDIFPIDNVPDSSVIRKFKGTRCNAAEFISTQVFYKENKDEASVALLRRTGAISYALRNIVGTVFGVVKSKKWFDHIDRLEQDANYESKQVTIAAGRKHYFGEIFDRSVLFPARYVPFCDIYAPVFNKVEDYLTNLYGNYMSIPPENKRESHYVRELKIK